MKAYKESLFSIIILILFVPQLLKGQSQQSPAFKNVFVMEIKDNIDPAMNRYVKLALEDAKERKADLVIIEMDTYGGAVNDADDIRTRIMDFEIPIWVFINKDAASAGALISIACDSIFMAPGASIGAATVVVADGQAAPDKYQSYMRSIMRSTAEAKGRNPQIAEAMVDQSIEIEGITKEGQVLTFSTSEAITHDFCEAEVTSIQDLLRRYNITDYEKFEFKLSFIDRVIAIFLNPFISGILILIIIGGIYFELQTPGVGFPILAALIALALYFIPHYLHGIANHWELIMFFIGIALIAVEIFIVPGFGVPGVVGITLTLSALVLMMINNDNFDFTFVNIDEIIQAIATTLAGLIGSIILMFFGGVRLTESSYFKRIALQDVQDSKDGYTSNFKLESFVGKTGFAYTVLRPSGKVMIEKELYDAYTRGNYIANGTKIIVVEDSGMSLKVKEYLEEPTSKEG
jgi:membrane-bound serine protease (ClpP class)